MLAAEEESLRFAGQPQVPPIPWAALSPSEGSRAASAVQSSGDDRLRVLVNMLLGGSSSEAEASPVPLTPAKSAGWATLATHLPGRSGRECRERWGVLTSPPASPAAPPLSKSKMDIVEAAAVRVAPDRPPASPAVPSNLVEEVTKGAPKEALRVNDIDAMEL